MTNAHQSRTSQAWWFQESCAADIQALVGTGFRALGHGCALLLTLPEGAGGGWLRAVPVTPASESRVGQNTAAALALTARGLLRTGLPPDVLDRFAAPFREGMTQPDRARRLGDAKDTQDTPDAPGVPGTVAPGGLLWSGATQGAVTDMAAPGHCAVDAMVMLYAATAQRLEDATARIRLDLSLHGAEIARIIPFAPLPDKDQPMREPFGFADGISQPFPEDAPEETERDRAILTTTGDASVGAALAHHRIRTGDILFGRRDAYGERAGGIFLRADEGGAAAKELDQGAAPPGQRDLGWNGSYLVARELRQDVPGFWAAMRRIAEAQGMTPEQIAEKIVGRAMDGGLLTPDGPSHANDRGFAADDPHGLGCPLGAHVRRANPRDSGARGEGERASRMRASNNHRILRRGRTYGPGPVADDTGQASTDRGLFFVCLNTDITRQFEFVQQTWLMNRQFAAREQTDPLVGPKGLFSIEAEPVRRRVTVETFVRLVGGAYFFLPGLKALHWLAMQPAAKPAAAVAPEPVIAPPQQPVPAQGAPLATKVDAAEPEVV